MKWAWIRKLGPCRNMWGLEIKKKKNKQNRREEVGRRWRGKVCYKLIRLNPQITQNKPLHSLYNFKADGSLPLTASWDAKVTAPKPSASALPTHALVCSFFTSACFFFNQSRSSYQVMDWAEPTQAWDINKIQSPLPLVCGFFLSWPSKYFIFPSWHYINQENKYPCWPFVWFCPIPTPCTGQTLTVPFVLCWAVDLGGGVPYSPGNYRAILLFLLHLADKWSSEQRFV